MAMAFRILILAALLPLGAAAAEAQQSGQVPDGCSGAIARWQETAGRESQGGHMDVSVYDQIQNEIARAATLCEAGQDAQARRLVAGSRHRHGYPQ